METERWRWPAGTTPQLVHAVALAFFAVTHFIVGFVIVAPLLGVEDVFDGSIGAIAMTAIQGAYAYVVVIHLALMRVNHVRLADLGWRVPVEPRDLGLGLLGAVALVILVFGPFIAAGQLHLDEVIGSIRGFSGGQRVQILLIGTTCRWAFLRSPSSARSRRGSCSER